MVSGMFKLSLGGVRSFQGNSRWFQEVVRWSQQCVIYLGKVSDGLGKVSGGVSKEADVFGKEYWNLSFNLIIKNMFLGTLWTCYFCDPKPNNCNLWWLDRV